MKLRKLSMYKNNNKQNVVNNRVVLPQGVAAFLGLAKNT